MDLPPLLFRPQRPPRPAIRTLNIRYGSGYGLAQAIQAEEHGGLDLIFLKKKTRTDSCYNNRRGYDVRGTVLRPSCAGGARNGVGLGLRYRPNGWESESTRSNFPNVVICEIVWKVSEVETV